MVRNDGRSPRQLRAVKITPNFVRYPEGSVLIELGNTKVLCNATIESGVPRWFVIQGKKGGWITAEYAMLPRSTHLRTPRETTGLSGRTQEIRRLIGRSLRASVDLDRIGERTIIVDCDVLQADGGTRSAAITGGYLALCIALNKLIQNGAVADDILIHAVAAISVGLVDQTPMLDLCYSEDSTADVDMNVVMTEEGDFIEIQSTAEGIPFDKLTFNQMLDLAANGIAELLNFQKQALTDLLDE